MAAADWFFYAFLVMFFVLVPAGMTYGLVKARRAYRALAEELLAQGFQSAPPGLFSSGLAGSFRGRDAQIRHVQHGKSGPWTTAVAVAVSPPPGFALRVDPEGAGAAIAKFFGAAEAKLDDPVFDAAFRVRTPDPERASFALDAATRASLVAERPWRLTIDGARVTHHLKGRVHDPARIGQALALVARVAERVEATR